MSEMMKYYDNLQVQTPEFWQTNRHNFFSVIRNYERNHIKNSTLESYRVLSFQGTVFIFHFFFFNQLQKQNIEQKESHILDIYMY